jgi:hypothetical protein
MENSSEHGRRGAEGEFPFGENTAYADLGRKIRRYSISGHFVENNHIAQAAALIAVCESPGPGILIHPTRGAVMAACVKLNVKDDALNAQGETLIDMEFVEANIVSTGFSLGASIFGLSLTDLYSAVHDSFVGRYKPDEVRYYDKPQILETAAESIEQLRNEFARAIAATAQTEDWYKLSTFDIMIEDPPSLNDAEKVFAAFQNGSYTVASKLAGQAKFDAFKRIANWSAKVSDLPEEAGDTEDSLYSTLRVIAVGQIVRAVLEIPVTTLSAALRQYDQVVDILGQEIDIARAICDNYVYLQLRDYESKVKKSLLDRAYTLPALVEYDFGGSVHSLEAAYQIYNDAKLFGSIEANNPGSWPFIVGPLVTASRSLA